MENIKKYLPWTIRVLISFLFLLSAVAKMYPSPYFAISTFEVKQLYPMGFNETFAAYFSRILIGIELALGILILQPNYLRKIIVPGTFLMLAVFVVELTYEIISGGNSGNCGCFGSLLPMTPLEAIIKNLVSMAMLTYLFIALPQDNPDHKNIWVISTGFLAMILAVFMIAPIQPKSEVVETEIVAPEIIEMPELIKADTSAATTTAPTVTDSLPKTVIAPVAEAPKEETEPAKRKSGYAHFFPKIDQGKKVLCFFVPGCDHCREVAKELTEMKQKDKNFPKIDILFMNEEADLIPEFFTVAGSEYPYKIVEIIPFWKMLGTGKEPPGVKYLWNGNEYKYYYGITDQKFNGADFHKLVQKPYKELKKK